MQRCVQWRGPWWYCASDIQPSGKIEAPSFIINDAEPYDITRNV
jgi:hypothetical protein